MNKIENVLEVLDNRATIPFGLSYEEREHRKSELRATHQISTRWTYLGSTYEDLNCPQPLPDGSGLVYATDGWKTWVVLNPMGQQRLTICVPRISNRSKPENGEIGQPSYRSDLPKHVMYGEGGDGDRNDVRFYFDMRDGTLLRAEFVGRHW